MIFPPIPPEGVKRSGFGEMRDAAHVQGPEKFVCQNEAVVSSGFGLRVSEFRYQTYFYE
jgi:hypothetical protein